jgi:hypothetical protein
MGQDEQDRIIGRLYREAGEAKRQLSLVETEIDTLREGIKSLYSEFVLLKSGTVNYRFDSLSKYFNLEEIKALLEQKEEAARKVEEFDRRVKELGG